MHLEPHRYAVNADLAGLAPPDPPTSLDAERPDVAQLLQPALTDLVELQIQAKHLHWNITGAGFFVLHTQLDVIAAAAAEHADKVAERMRALRGAPNGRSHDIAHATMLAPAPPGLQPVPAGAAHTADILRTTTATLGQVRQLVEPEDPATVGVLNTAVLSLHEQLWLLCAEHWD